MKKGLVLLTVAGLCLCATLAACRAQKDFSGGKALTPEEMNALKDTLSEKEKPQEPSVEPAPAPTPDETDRCYYIQSGGVYHLDRSCSYIAENANVISATVAEAQNAGKTRACSRCGA